MGNCKLSDNAYDVLDRDESISLLKRSFWQKLSEPAPLPDKNDCDNRALRAIQRAQDRYVGEYQPAIGYLVGSFNGQPHAVNVLVCVDGVYLWDDMDSKIVPLVDDIWFIWI
jgi:hypothetical protein